MHRLKERVKRITVRLLEGYSRARKGIYLTAHQVINIFRSELPEHLIICGPAKSGTSDLYDLIRAHLPDAVFAPNRKCSALNTLSVFSRKLVTACPSDLFRVDDLFSAIGHIRKLKVLIIIRDPRELIITIDNSFPAQYYQSWDFSIMLESNKSFTGPGVAAAFKKVRQVTSSFPKNSLVLRYEDLFDSPLALLGQIEAFCSLAFKERFDSVESGQRFGADAPPNEPTTPKDELNTEPWTHEANRRRISLQLRLFPEIESHLQLYGYTSSNTCGLRALPKKELSSGTVVAMHTPDSVYRKEASRLRRSLDRLGINHFIEELPEARELAEIEGDFPEWYIQKLARYYKPAWLLRLRREIDGPMLYTDADSFVHKNPWPYLNLYQGDIAVFIRSDAPTDLALLNSSVIWLNDTKGALELLEEWTARCRSERENVKSRWPNVKPSASDQPILSRIVREDESGARRFCIQRLPPTMMAIFDFDKIAGGSHVYIEQLQASRVAKAKLPAKFHRPEVHDSRFERICELENILKGAPAEENRLGYPG